MHPSAYARAKSQGAAKSPDRLSSAQESDNAHPVPGALCTDVDSTALETTIRADKVWSNPSVRGKSARTFQGRADVYPCREQSKDRCQYENSRGLARWKETAPSLLTSGKLGASEWVEPAAALTTAGSKVDASSPSNSGTPFPHPSANTKVRNLMRLALRLQQSQLSSEGKLALDRMLILFAQLHGRDGVVRLTRYLRLHPPLYQTPLDPYREMKALGRWIRDHNHSRSLQITHFPHGVFGIHVHSVLCTAAKVATTFSMHADALVPLAQLFAIPLPQRQPVNQSDIQAASKHHLTLRQRTAMGISFVSCTPAFSTAVKAELLEEYYRVFLSRRRTNPLGHGYGSDSDRTPGKSSQSPTSPRSAAQHHPSFPTQVSPSVTQSDRDDGPAISRKRLRKTAGQKDAELRCPETAVGRGHAKCLTYSTKFVHRLKSDHLMPDHEFQRHELEIDRGKRGETEENKWSRLFLKLNPDWTIPPPSPYYVANCQFVTEFASFLRTEADQLQQVGFRALFSDIDATSPPRSIAHDGTSQPSGLLHQVSNHAFIDSGILHRSENGDRSQSHQSIFEEQSNSPAGINPDYDHSHLLPLPSTSIRMNIPGASGVSSSRTSLSRMLSSSDAAQSQGSSPPSSRQAPSFVQPTICRCKRHSTICGELRNALPRSETCRGLPRPVHMV